MSELTDAERIELSLRARLALSRSISGALATYAVVRMFGDFRISRNLHYVVAIERQGKCFFWHRSRGNPPSQPDPRPRSKDIDCSRDDWAKVLLLRLRETQVLSQLANL